MNRIVVDFETKSIEDLAKRGADNYARHPSTDALCVGFAIDDEPVELLQPGDYEFAPFLDQVANGLTVIAHNAPFEIAIWNNVMRPKYGWPELKPEQCVCTMAQAYAMGCPGKLENAAPALGIDHRKDMAGNRVMLQLSQPREIVPCPYCAGRGGLSQPCPDCAGTGQKITWWTEEEFPEKYQQLYNYCIQDVKVERALAKRLVSLNEKETRVWQLDQVINQRGIQIDRAAATAALGLVTQVKAGLDARIREISKGAIATCTAVKQIADYLKTRGVAVPDGIAKEETKSLLRMADLPSDCREILTLRQEAGKSSTAKLETMISRAGTDGRLRGMFQYHGATTGRWAGRGPQPQNLPRPSLSPAAIDGVFELFETSTPELAATIDMLYGSPLSVISDCLRGLFVPKKGHEFVGADFSNIEGRGLAWAAGESWKLQAFEAYDRGELPDIYVQTYARSFNVSMDSVDDKKRQVGKVLELSMGFGGGRGAFQTMAKNYGVKTSDDRAEELKRAWREAHPATVNYWRELESAARGATLNPAHTYQAGAPGREIKFRAMGSFLWARLPSGRPLCYPYPKIEPVETPWGEMKDGITYMSQNSVTNKWERDKTFGGKICENIVQATARDLLVEAMLRIDSPGTPIVLHVHDEIVTEPLKNTIDVKQFERKMAETPPWAKGFPIAAKGFARARYGK